MAKIKPALRFLSAAGLVYCALMMSKPLCGEAFAKGFRSVAQALFGNIGATGVVEFQAYSSSADGFDTMALAGNMQRRTPDGYIDGIRTPLDSWSFAFSLLALTVALALGAPLPWRRRLRAAALGLMVATFYIYCKLAVLVAYLYNSKPELDILAFSDMWRAAVIGLYTYGVDPVAPTYIIAVVIWIAVAFQRADRMHLAGLFDIVPLERRRSLH